MMEVRSGLNYGSDKLGVAACDLSVSQWRDRAPHLESVFQFVPVVLRCGGKPVSSSHPFLGAER